MDQIRILAGQVMQMEAHSADSTIVGEEAAAKYFVVAAALPDLAFATILHATQAEEEIVIAVTGPVDSGPKHAEGKAVVVVAAAAAASEAAVGPIHSESHFDRWNFPKMLGGWR